MLRLQACDIFGEQETFECVEEHPLQNKIIQHLISQQQQWDGVGNFIGVIQNHNQEKPIPIAKVIWLKERKLFGLVTYERHNDTILEKYEIFRIFEQMVHVMAWRLWPI